jgi:3-hydroxybutyryl-CoA dehydratase
VLHFSAQDGRHLIDIIAGRGAGRFLGKDPTPRRREEVASWRAMTSTGWPGCSILPVGPTRKHCSTSGRRRDLPVVPSPQPPLTVGQRATFSRTITQADVEAFAGLTGDRNPLHLDDAFARRSRFGRPIAQGILVAGVISAALGLDLPGPGTIYLSQSLRFLRPVYPGDTVTATIEIIAIREDKGIVTLRTTCTNQAGQPVVEGEAVVLVGR